MRREVINVVYKNDSGWHYGYIVGDNWYYGILYGQPLVELTKIKFASDVPSIDIYQPLPVFVKNKKVNGAIRIEECVKKIMDQYRVSKMYVKPVSTFLPDVSRASGICGQCVKACKSDNVTACGQMVRDTGLVRQNVHFNG